jgi:hypothetical protein
MIKNIFAVAVSLIVIIPAVLVFIKYIEIYY